MRGSIVGQWVVGIGGVVLVAACGGTGTGGSGGGGAGQGTSSGSGSSGALTSSGGGASSASTSSTSGSSTTSSGSWECTPIGADCVCQSPPALSDYLPNCDPTMYPCCFTHVYLADMTPRCTCGDMTEATAAPCDAWLASEKKTFPDAMRVEHCPP
jgi:hypothetical protein